MNHKLVKQPALVFAWLCCFAINSAAQPARTYTASEILQQLHKLKVCGSVLYIAAHPDDENTRLLAWLANEKLYRTGYLSLTRGDGGQNLIGTEQGVDLGLIRTQELMAARRIDGAEQFFTRAFDFGFSKNPDETFRTWDKEKILADVVWVVRKFQPDVIIARFPEDGRAGHGHHSASGILAREAFTAAADDKRFPEQFQYGVKPWQAKRMLWNTFNFGGANTQSEDQFKLDVGQYNPLLGKSYGELAAESRSQHKSQGFGVPSGRGVQLEYFTTIAGDKPVNSLMDGVDAGWDRTLTGGALINRSPKEDNISNFVDSIIGNYNPLKPELSVPALLQLYTRIESVRNNYWREQKLAEVRKLIALCAGLYFEATTTEPYGVPGDSLKINLSINARSVSNAKLLSVHYGQFKISRDTLLPRNRNFVQPWGILLPATQTLTQPYWLKEEMGKATFTISNQQQAGQADGPYEMVDFVFEINGQLLAYQRPLQYKFTDPVKGEVFSPVYIVPAVSVSTQTPVIFNTKLRSNPFDITITPNRNFKAGNEALLIGRSRCDTVYGLGELPGELAKNMARHTAHNRFNWQEPVCQGQLWPAVTIDGKTYGGELVRIEHDHIPAMAYTRSPQVKFIYHRTSLSKKQVAYIPGAGDKIPEALKQMDYKVTLLHAADDVTPENLKKFDAVITGVRAYNTNDWMNSVYDNLMQYVQNGGNLIVQYNTSNQVGPVKAKISPYPFTISRNRVTDETAAVRLLQPKHPVLNNPNPIGEDDFKGWVQERSVYDATTVDSAYVKIISMNDPGEPADEGSLIVGPYGKGNFVYCGLALFRQLPAGVPGAYKLLANLVELPKNK